MSRFRSRWLALFGGVTLIALSMSGAMAAEPAAGANLGLQVSAFVHHAVGDVEATDEQAADDTEAPANDTAVPAEETAASDHGTCVAEVAQGEDVGGDNENHGGAVSEAARVTCQEDAIIEAPTTDDATDNADESEVEADDADAAAEDAETEDAAASDAGTTHSDGHGGDKGGDSSGD